VPLGTKPKLCSTTSSINVRIANDASAIPAMVNGRLRNMISGSSCCAEKKARLNRQGQAGCARLRDVSMSPHSAPCLSLSFSLEAADER